AAGGHVPQAEGVVIGQGLRPMRGSAIRGIDLPFPCDFRMCSPWHRLTAGNQARIQIGQGSGLGPNSIDSRHKSTPLRENHEQKIIAMFSPLPTTEASSALPREGPSWGRIQRHKTGVVPLSASYADSVPHTLWRALH